MNARQFYEEVKKMRQLQRQYFATKDKSRKSMALMLSIKQEQLIDAEIERVEKILNQK